MLFNKRCNSTNCCNNNTDCNYNNCDYDSCHPEYPCITCPTGTTGNYLNMHIFIILMHK